MSTDSTFGDDSFDAPVDLCSSEPASPPEQCERGETPSIQIFEESPFRPDAQPVETQADEPHGCRGCGECQGKCHDKEPDQVDVDPEESAVLGGLEEIQQAMDVLNEQISQSEESGAKIDPMTLPRQENEVDVWQCLKALFIKHDAAFAATRCETVPMLKGIEALNSFAQRFVLNRFFRSEFLCLPVDTRDYAVLLREGNQCDLDEWLKGFEDSLIPLIKQYDLPNISRPIAAAQAAK